MTDVPKLTLARALHILRNPWGWSEGDQREARLWAADELERLTGPSHTSHPPETAASSGTAVSSTPTELA